MSKFTIGVDVGGTNVKFGLVDASGRIKARSRLVTKSFKTRAALIKAISASIETFLSDSKIPKKSINGVGIGLPGLINPKDGVVIQLPNVPGWQNVPLKKLLQDTIKLPVYIENDVNQITLGEWEFGAGKKCAHLISMTLGTGVGAGLVLNNELYYGANYVAGELGHVPLNVKGPDCNCGGWACFERYVGNKILQKKAALLFKRKNIELEEVGLLAIQGDKKALRFWDEVGELVGHGLIGAINLLNPELIIIGGGISNNFKFFSPATRRIIQSRAMKVQSKNVKLVRAKLGDDAGIIGGHVLVKKMQRR